MLYVAAFHLRSRALGGLWLKGQRPKTLGSKGDLEYEVLTLDLDPAVVVQVQAGELRLFRDGSTVKPLISLDAAVEQAKAEGWLRFSAAGNLTLDEGVLREQQAKVV